MIRLPHSVYPIRDEPNAYIHFLAQRQKSRRCPCVMIALEIETREKKAMGGLSTPSANMTTVFC